MSSILEKNDKFRHGEMTTNNGEKSFVIFAIMAKMAKKIDGKNGEKTMAKWQRTFAIFAVIARRAKMTRKWMARMAKIA